MSFSLASGQKLTRALWNLFVGGPHTSPGTPKINYSSGVGNVGNVTQESNTRIVQTPYEVVFDHEISFNAGSTGLTIFALVDIPSGYVLKDVIWSAITTGVEFPAASNGGAVNQIAYSRSNVSVATTITARATYAKIMT